MLCKSGLKVFLKVASWASFKSGSTEATHIVARHTTFFASVL